MRWAIAAVLFSLGVFTLTYAAIALDTPDPLQDVTLPTKSKGAAGPPAPPEDSKITPHPTLDSGVAAALADETKQSLVVFDSAAYRYLWIDSTDDEVFKAVVLGLNCISRSSFLYRPEAIQAPGGVLVKVDMRQLFPREADLIEGIRTWEEFRFDPASSLLLTKDFIELAGIPLDLLPKAVQHGARKEKRAQADGTEVEVLVPFEELAPASGDVARLDAPDIDPRAFAQLKILTGSEAPITEYRYWLFRALSTIKDDGPYKTIFGGLYYDLRGIKKAKQVAGKEKATDEDLFFEQFGIGNIQAGETYERLLDRVRGDLRPSVFISDVTGKPRSIVGFHTSAEREGGSWGAVTWDIKDKSIDVRQHPILSHIKPRIDAQEAIFPGANGMPVFALFNGDGALQDEAPFDVVSDRTVPAPHTPRLQACIGCVRCHGVTQEMWQPLKDDLALLVQSGRLVPLADTSKANELAQDTQDRLLGLHSIIPGIPSGQLPRQQRVLDKALQRARDDFQLSVMELTGEWPRLAGRQTEVAKTACAKIGEIYNSYIYDPVTAREALQDIGLNVPASQAANVLAKLLPPGGGDPVLGFIPEDAVLAELTVPPMKVGNVQYPPGKVGRIDWSLRRGFAAGRANTAAKKLLRP